MSTLLLTRKQSREVDRRAIQEYGMSGLVLMENAGRGVVDTLEEIGIEGPVIVFCGKGNNAGDGFVIARHLEIRGYECRVFLLFSPAELTGDALVNYKILERSDITCEELASRENDHGQILESACQGADWLIDAILGTGATGAPRPPLDGAIQWINDQPIKKLAVDVPSGLDCDTGQPASPAVRSDHTCTFVAAKQGFSKNTAKEYLGKVHVLDIGTPPKLLTEITAQ